MTIAPSEGMKDGGSAATPAPRFFAGGAAGREAVRTRCRVMGIVNATPDSFSDGGRYNSPDEAVRRARNMMKEGAAMIDVGGESTRPGATPLDWREEWGRIERIVAALAPECSKKNVALSIDTYHPETARLAVSAGATMLNCVRADSVPAMAEICEETGAILCAPSSCFDAVRRLAGRGAAAGGPPSLYIDPMVGFGTTREEDLALIRSVPALAQKCAVLAGVSRKRIVARLTGRDTAAGKRLGGSVAIAAWCALAGASAVRVHDVRETVDAIAAVEAIGKP